MFGGQDESNQQNLEMERAREEHVQNIRRTNREEIISKRRNFNINIDKFAQESAKQQRGILGNNDFSDKIDQFTAVDYYLADLSRLAACIQSGDPLQLHEGAIGLRKLLSNDDNPPIQQVIDLNLVPKLIEMVKQTTYPYLQMEATWSLTNIASGNTTHCQSIVDKGGIPIFLKLLSSPVEMVVQQAVWVIGNIAGDSHVNRDYIIKLGGLNQLIRVVENTNNHNIFKQGGWALANLCRGSPKPAYENVKNALPTLARVLLDNSVTDLDIISDCCWALSYMSDGSKTRISKVVDTGIVQRLVQLLRVVDSTVQIPCIRTLGNIATGNQSHTDVLIKGNALQVLYSLLESKKALLRREAAWTLSNIAAGNRAQVMAVLSNSQLVVKLLDLLENDNPDVRKEVGWLFSNTVNSAQPLFLCRFIQEYQIMQQFVNLLSQQSERLIDVGLEGIKNFLAIGEKIKGTSENPMIRELNKYKGIDKLQDLQNHKSTALYNKAYRILQAFFVIEDPLP